jgi:hypothetical protein
VKAVNSPHVSHVDLFRFVSDVDEALFLFDDAFAAYLEQIYQHGVTVVVLQRQLDSMPIGEQRTSTVSRLYESLTWLSEQLPALRSRLVPFMRFR